MDLHCECAGITYFPSSTRTDVAYPALDFQRVGVEVRHVVGSSQQPWAEVRALQGRRLCLCVGVGLPGSI